MHNRTFDYDYLIVGAGFYGASFARAATDLGKKCLVMDKRGHIAGAAYDVPVADYYVSEYGAHIFHTNSLKVWDFFSRFTTFKQFINRPKVLSLGKMLSFPINLMTLQQLYGVTSPAEAEEYLAGVRLNIESPSNFEDWMLSMVGEDLYRRFYYHYTKKQWFKEPRELPVSIAQRIPIRLTYDENYFITKFQGIPDQGYTNLIRNMLDGIKVELGVAYSKDYEKMANKVIYTGPIDEYYNYEHGELDFRTLQFTKEVYAGDKQGNAVVNYTDSFPSYIRSIEHRHFYRHGEAIKHYGAAAEPVQSVVTYDRPVKFEKGMDPFYPIRDKINSAMYAKYAAVPNDKVSFGGRLGEYKYLDMDQSAASALAAVSRFEPRMAW